MLDDDLPTEGGLACAQMIVQDPVALVGSARRSDIGVTRHSIVEESSRGSLSKVSLSADLDLLLPPVQGVSAASVLEATPMDEEGRSPLLSPGELHTKTFADVEAAVGDWGSQVAGDCLSDASSLSPSRGAADGACFGHRVHCQATKADSVSSLAHNDEQMPATPTAAMEKREGPVISAVDPSVVFDDSRWPSGFRSVYASNAEHSDHNQERGASGESKSPTPRSPTPSKSSSQADSASRSGEGLPCLQSGTRIAAKSTGSSADDAVEPRQSLSNAPAVQDDYTAHGDATSPMVSVLCSGTCPGSPSQIQPCLERAGSVVDAVGGDAQCEHIAAAEAVRSKAFDAPWYGPTASKRVGDTASSKGSPTSSVVSPKSTSPASPKTLPTVAGNPLVEQHVATSKRSSKASLVPNASETYAAGGAGEACQATLRPPSDSTVHSNAVATAAPANKSPLLEPSRERDQVQPCAFLGVRIEESSASGPQPLLAQERPEWARLVDEVKSLRDRTALLERENARLTRSLSSMTAVGESSRGDVLQQTLFPNVNARASTVQQEFGTQAGSTHPHHQVAVQPPGLCNGPLVNITFGSPGEATAQTPGAPVQQHLLSTMPHPVGSISPGGHTKQTPTLLQAPLAPAQQDVPVTALQSLLQAAQLLVGSSSAASLQSRTPPADVVPESPVVQQVPQSTPVESAAIASPAAANTSPQIKEFRNELRSLASELRATGGSITSELRLTCQAFQDAQRSLYRQAPLPHINSQIASTDPTTGLPVGSLGIHGHAPRPRFPWACHPSYFRHAGENSRPESWPSSSTSSVTDDAHDLYGGCRSQRFRPNEQVRHSLDSVDTVFAPPEISEPWSAALAHGASGHRFDRFGVDHDEGRDHRGQRAGCGHAPKWLPPRVARHGDMTETHTSYNDASSLEINDANDGFGIPPMPPLAMSVRPSDHGGRAFQGSWDAAGFRSSSMGMPSSAQSANATLGRGDGFGPRRSVDPPSQISAGSTRPSRRSLIEKRLVALDARLHSLDSRIRNYA